ncbi:MAG: alpha-ribazole phosphatase [Selenomonadaceae bacterium]|nr:alpha-ribazole phosphatase [Selenomonadaceae bacterium]
MTKVVLIRHGETEWNLLGKYQGQTDIALTDKGREQAKLLAKHFPVKELHAVYSSDLSRAMETAGFVAEKFSLKVRPEPSFREMNFGEWEGLTHKEIATRWEEGLNNFITRPDILKVPNGENFQVLQKRAVKRLYELVEKHDGETVAITAHGGVLRTILAAALEMPLKNLWRLRLFNTAVSIVNYAETPVVECINDTKHLMLDNPTFTPNSVDIFQVRQ